MNQSSRVSSTQFTKDQFLAKYWKHCLVSATFAFFMLFPKPILFIFGPIIKRFRKSYSKVRPTMTHIIFTVNRKLSAKQIKKANIFEPKQNNILFIDLFDQDSQMNEKINQDNELMSDLQAENIVLKIKMIGLQTSFVQNQNYAVVVKGNKKMLQKVEAKVFNLKKNELFKIQEIEEFETIHILSKNHERNTFEQVITTIAQNRKQSEEQDNDF